MALDGSESSSDFLREDVRRRDDQQRREHPQLDGESARGRRRPMMTSMTAMQSSDRNVVALGLPEGQELVHGQDGDERDRGVEDVRGGPSR